MNNADKHRLIHATVCWAGFDQIRVTGKDVAKVTFAVTGKQMENGAPLTLVIAEGNGPNPVVQVEPRATFDVLFGEGSDRAEGLPVYETMVSIGRRVDGIISKFEDGPLPSV